MKIKLFVSTVVCLCILLSQNVWAEETIGETLFSESDSVEIAPEAEPLNIEITEEWEEGASSQLPKELYVPDVNLFSNQQFPGNYGNQLSEFEVEIYEKMGMFKDYISTASIDVELGDRFSFSAAYETLKDGTYVDNANYQAVRMELRSEVFRAADAYFKDSMEMYWVRSISYQATISYTRPSEIEADTEITARISRIKIKPNYYYEGILDEIEGTNARLAEIIDSLNQQTYENRYRQVEAVYNYVKELGEYNYADMEAASNHTLTGILLDKYGHKCTCEGYAKLVKYMLDQYSVPNVLVVGGNAADGEGNVLVDHIWNVVQMEDGQWYLLDATWDDTGGGTWYFLAGSAATGSSGVSVAEDHFASPFFSYTQYEPFILPNLAENSYTPEGEKPILSDTTELKAEPAGKGRVRLSWTPVPDAEGYLVYGIKNGVYGYVGMTTKGVTYIDSKALDESNNFYWVYPYAADDSGKMQPGGCSEYVCAKGICPRVTDLRAESVSGGVKLSWAASYSAEGYLVYGRVSSGEYGYRGMTTQGRNFIDRSASKNVNNFYWVFPYHRNMQGKMVVGIASDYVFEKAK